VRLVAAVGSSTPTVGRAVASGPCTTGVKVIATKGVSVMVGARTGVKDADASTVAVAVLVGSATVAVGA
jgi:hypothetical protein